MDWKLICVKHDSKLNIFGFRSADQIKTFEDFTSGSFSLFSFDILQKKLLISCENNLHIHQ